MAHQTISRLLAFVVFGALAPGLPIVLGQTASSPRVSVAKDEPAPADAKGSSRAKSADGKSADAKPETKGASQKALISVKNLHDGCDCEGCGGKGNIVGKVEVGPPKSVLPPDALGRGWYERQFRDEWRKCPTCGGDGVTKKDKLSSLLRSVARNLDGLDPRDAKWTDRHRDEALDLLRAVARRGLHKFASRFNDNTLSTLNGDKDPKGETVSFVAKVDHDEADDQGRREHRFVLSKTVTVVLLDARLCDTLLDQSALVSGVVDRRERNGLATTIYLRHGLAVRNTDGKD